MTKTEHGEATARCEAALTEDSCGAIYDAAAADLPAALEMLDRAMACLKNGTNAEVVYLLREWDGDDSTRPGNT